MSTPGGAKGMRHPVEPGKKLDIDYTKILAVTQRGLMVLLTLKAIWIRELVPNINTKMISARE